MSDQQHHQLSWLEILDEIEDNSPYEGTIVAAGIELFLAGGDDVPGGIVGTIHTPDDWERLKLDAHRFGVWPSRVSFQEE